MIRYKSIKISSVLDWQSQKEIDPLKIKYLSVKSDKLFPFYGQSTLNNGIISYLSLTDDVLNNKDGNPTILIHSNNQNIVYLETPFYLKDGHGATSVLQSKFLNEKTALYLITCIKKVIINKFSYNDKATKIALKNIEIQLPVDANGNIDYVYMENYIINLEKENIKELDKHLNNNGFNQYNLTDDELVVIERFKNGKIKFKEFSIGGKNGLFDIHPTKSYKVTNATLFKEEGNTPVVSNTSINNGIVGYSNLKPTEKGNMITYSDTTTSESVFYQPNDFIGYPHVQGLYALNGIKWNEKTLLYFVTLFKKCANGRFDYANKFTRKIASDMMVQLPITSNDEIDFQFITYFINAQEKLVIKDLVQWKNKKLEGYLLLRK